MNFGSYEVRNGFLGTKTSLDFFGEKIHFEIHFKIHFEIHFEIHSEIHFEIHFEI